jgi:hypothetical protein
MVNVLFGGPRAGKMGEGTRSELGLLETRYEIILSCDHHPKIALVAVRTVAEIEAHAS